MNKMCAKQERCISQILQVVRDAIPAFEGVDKPQKSVIAEALLASLPEDDLREVYDAIRLLGSVPYGLDSRFKWLLKPRPARRPAINEPILDLLRMYKDKKSRKVEYARGQLMRRYEGQSYVHQHGILRAFLSGDRKACDWAARRLRDDWREPFAEILARRWESTPSKDLALTAVLHLPEDYVLQQQDVLCQYVGYPLICYRLLDVTGFTLDEGRLGIPGLFYVMGRRGRTDKVEYLQRKLGEYIHSLEAAGCSLKDIPFLEGFDRILPAMSKLGMKDDIIRLYEIQNQ